MSNKKAQVVRFKMRVIDNDRSESTLARIVLNGVFDTEAQDQGGDFIAGEPQGPIRFQIRNPNVADLFVQGQDYYLDFAPTFQEAGSNDDEDSTEASVAERTATWNEESAKSDSKSGM